MENINKKTLIKSTLIPVILGFLSFLLSKGGLTVYRMLEKPPLTPPDFIFPIVWTILYVLMGISSYIVYTSDNPFKDRALTIYGVQLFFNFFWSIIFFGFSQYFVAFIWLVLLIIAIIAMIYTFYKVNPVAAYLQIPYLIWCIFAAYLNLSIYLLNK